MSKKNLSDWLSYIEGLHSKSIDLGLDRIREVFNRLKISETQSIKIVVGGTNGKGSTCTYLESIYSAAGFSVGKYTSPHLIKFNERIRINQQEVSDELIIEALEHIELIREGISLSYFEYTTLAAFYIFKNANLDLWILEVGLGGRLDAVNLIDADASIISSIDIDHTEYLGNTREKIGFEKAGIFRKDKPGIVSDPLPPQSVLDHAQEIGCDLWLINRDFNYSADKLQWAFASREGKKHALPHPALRGANQLLNASAALACIDALKGALPVPIQYIKTGLVNASLSGRFEILPGQPVTVIDVAHNPHSASALAHNLKSMSYFPYTYAVFGVLKDKDLEGIVKCFKGIVDYWYLCDLDGPRGSEAIEVAERIRKLLPPDADGLPKILTFSSPIQAYKEVKSNAKKEDRIVVFGSFLAVSEIKEFIDK